MYHYIRGESFLKLYVLFNMLEMFERWCRSVGVDLFDLLLASVRQPWRSLLLKYAVTLAYCFVHATMHLIRVILLNVAINTSSNAVFLIIVTNNFAEIKSTVFKRYEEKSLFPIITSDMVERFYLLLDILFVLARLSISQHSGTFTALDVSFWLFLLVVLEIGTDWIKFCLITKFSEMQAKTFEVYREVLMADILLCRCGQLSGQASGSADPPDGHALGIKDGALSASLARGFFFNLHEASRRKLFFLNHNADRPVPTVPYRGIHSFSHVLQRRLGFSGVPMTTILVVHLFVLARAPCAPEVHHPQATAARRHRLMVGVFVAGFFFICLLAPLGIKLCARNYNWERREGIVLVGFAARRRGRISRGRKTGPGAVPKDQVPVTAKATPRKFAGRRSEGMASDLRFHKETVSETGNHDIEFAHQGGLSRVNTATAKASLRQLGAEERRAMLQRLTQAKRLALERWMLSTARAASKHAKGPGKRPNHSDRKERRARRRGGCSASAFGRWAVVHLGRGFYAQAKLAAETQEVISSLGTSACELAARSAIDGLDFEKAVVDAVAKATSRPANVRLLFRSRMTFSRAVRLSTPLRGDLSEALSDWRAVRAARGEVHARCLEEHELAGRWRRTSAAWSAIWAKKGMTPGRLQRQLSQKESASLPLLARLASRKSSLLQREMETEMDSPKVTRRAGATARKPTDSPRCV
ncbi:unnamed protein product [Effrenium voratum]|nr:unnamed protein product [Effrenium voratum]